MKKTMMRSGALALSLLAGAALMAAPVTTATAGSIQKNGYFGGTWGPIGPGNNRHVKRYHRYNDFYVGGYYGPRYYGYYGPPYGYYGPPYGYYGPPYGYYGPGFSITIR